MKAKLNLKRRSGFTLIELLVVVSIIGLLIGILLPALGAARQSARQMQSNTQVRGIHQGMLSFADSNGGWFPGIESDGVTAADASTLGATPQPAARSVGTYPEVRYRIMLEADLFSGEYAVSPVEDRDAWDGGVVTTANVSFAMLKIGGPTLENLPSNRRAEWGNETLNTQAIVLSDRNTGVGTGTTEGSGVSSIHTKTDSGDWAGSVVYNDNHVDFAGQHEFENLQYGQGPSATATVLDNLFIQNADGGSFIDGTGIKADAAMVFQENNTGFTLQD